MTQLCCPSCRLRFSRAAAAHLVACPECGSSPEPVSSAERVLGFRLWSDGDGFVDLPVALAAALTIPAPDEPSR